MKKNLRNNLAIFFMGVLVVLASCSKSNEHAEHADTYTCPMHPTVVADKPGTCPVCGMDLVRKARDSEEVKITGDLANLLKSPSEIVTASIKTIKAEFKAVPMIVEAQGVVTYDTRSIYTISSRVGGRLEKVFLKYAFQPVAKGQKVAEIYSPELITAQRELLYLLDRDALNTEIIQATKSKLLLLGASQAQIASLIASKETSDTFAVYSPYTGYLIMGGQEAPGVITSSSSGSSPNGMDAMGGSANSSASAIASQSSATESFIREGTYVSSGQTLFRIVNPASLRIELDLAAAQVGSIKAGQIIQLDLGNGREEKATVDFIQPFFAEGQQFVKLRVYIDKMNDLHIGHLVKARIELQSSESLWVPKEAVLDLGIHQIVFVKERGVLKPKKITAGLKAGGWIEVKQGLASTDEIASNAQFLVDSESFVRVGN